MTRSRMSIVAVLAVLAVAAPVVAGASTWEIDPAHTNVQFKIRHLMVSNVRGEFRAVKGSATVPSDDPTKASVKAVIETASIETGNADRDKHLRSADFLDVAKFPTMEFTSKRVEAAGSGRFQVVGDLLLHGVTREVTLEVEGPTRTITSPLDGSTRAGATAKTTLNRKEFGLSWNKALEAGGVVVGEEVQVEIEVELVRKD